VPTYEYYGFVLYLFSSLAFLMYLLWSYLPSPFLHALGIYYYPNRWWSLAIPSWLVMGLCYIYVALAAYNTGYLTLPMSSIETIIDEAANVATLDGKGHMKSLHAHAHVHAAGAGAGSGSGRRKNSNTGNGVGHGHSGKDARREKRELREKRKEGRESEVERDWRALWSVGTDACLDVPLGGVCEVLYGEGRDRDPEEDGGVYGWVEG
jgi:phosphatidylinositol glycan class P protein